MGMLLLPLPFWAIADLLTSGPLFTVPGPSCCAPAACSPPHFLPPTRFTPRPPRPRLSFFSCSRQTSTPSHRCCICTGWRERWARQPPAPRRVKVRQVLETQVWSLQTARRISPHVRNSRDGKGQPSHKALNAEEASWRRWGWM